MAMHTLADAAAIADQRTIDRLAELIHHVPTGRTMNRISDLAYGVTRFSDYRVKP